MFTQNFHICILLAIFYGGSMTAVVLNKIGYYMCEPFNQGVQNIQSAWKGRRVDQIDTNLNSSERMTHMAVGVILLIPIINGIALAILESMGSANLFSKRGTEGFCPFTQPIILETVQNDEELDLQARIDGDALISDDFELPEEPQVSAAEYAARKQRFIDLMNQENNRFKEFDRLGNLYEEEMRAYNEEIRRFPDALQQFQRNRGADPVRAPQKPEPIEIPGHINPRITNFNLDEMLAPFRIDNEPEELSQFYDYANVPERMRRELDQCLRRYEGRIGDQERSAKTQLSRLIDFLIQKRPTFDGTQKEGAFKGQIRNICARIVDAHRNCVDQVNSQLESIMIDVIANFQTANGEAPNLQQYLINRAAYTNFQYMTNLIKEICSMEYPLERHVADLERAVKQRVADILQLQGELFRAGAILNFAHLEEYTENVINIFLNGRATNPNRIPNQEGHDRNPQLYRLNLELRQKESKYDPKQYLINNLRRLDAGARNLRNTILLWARKHYQLEAEDAQTEEFVRIISEDPVFTADEGGNLKYSALLYFLEEIGILMD